MRVSEASSVVPPSPEERRAYLKVAAPVPGEQAFATLADARYSLVRESVIDPGTGGLEEDG